MGSPGADLPAFTCGFRRQDVGDRHNLVVLALTNARRWLVLVIALVLALFGCTPTIYVEPANTIPFEQMVTLDATIGARVEAHTIAGLVRGDAPSKSTSYLEPMRLPEAFSLGGTVPRSIRRRNIESVLLA